MAPLLELGLDVAWSELSRREARDNLAPTLNGAQPESGAKKPSQCPRKTMSQFASTPAMLE